jgi:hypothetical protein
MKDVPCEKDCAGQFFQHEEDKRMVSDEVHAPWPTTLRPKTRSAQSASRRISRLGTFLVYRDGRLVQHVTDVYRLARIVQHVQHVSFSAEQSPDPETLENLLQAAA